MMQVRSLNLISGRLENIMHVDDKNEDKSSFEMIQKQGAAKKWSIVIVLVFLLFPLVGMAYFLPFISDNFSISVEHEHSIVLFPYGDGDSVYSITLLIPYAELTSIANFDEPWPVSNTPAD